MKKIIRKIILFTCALAFINFLIMFIAKKIEYNKGTKIYNKAQEYVEKEPTIILTEDINQETNKKTIIEYKLPIKKFDYDKIKKNNKDVIGWICIPYCDISYPIVQGLDNNFYLHHAYNGEESNSGSIFLDYTQNPLFTDKHVFLYGHSMLNGTMFGMLRRLDGNDYYNKMVNTKNTNVYIYIKDKVLIYDIFSIVDTNREENPKLLSVNYPKENNKTSCENYINLLLNNSHKKTNLVPNWNDKFLTMYTCQNATGPERHLVTAKLIATIDL